MKSVKNDAKPIIERVPLEEAARILGMSPQGVREHMKRGLFTVPIGYVTKISKRYQYHIYRDMLNKHLGREEVSDDGRNREREENQQ